MNVGQAGRLSDRRYDKVFDNAASLQEARLRLPLKQLMEQFGKAPKSGRWNRFKCPFCPFTAKAKAKAAVFKGDGGGDLFKCRETSCPTGTAEDGKAFDEVAFLAYVSNLNRKDAFVSYLKQTGVWKEREKFKSPNGSETRAAAPAEGEGEKSDAVECLPTGLESDAVERVPTIPNVVQFPAVAGSSDSSTGSPTPSIDDASHATAQPLASPVTESPRPVAETGEAAGIQEENKSDGVEPVPTEELNKSDGVERVPTDGIGVVRAFYGRLTLTAEDEERLFHKRGLTSRTSAALGFRSSPRSNQEFLEALRATADRDELLASGLFVRKPGSADLKSNKQFCGWGIKGKKLKVQGPPAEEEEEDRDEWEWGWTQTVLVPYFDVVGELIGLRPHKGMGHRGTLVGTPRLYIPRNGTNGTKGTNEEFRNVVITEGEFKAAALWQVLGTGRQDGRKAWGVASLPGISFARHYAIRQELEVWLRRVRAWCVRVCFDNEEKSEPRLADGSPHPSYKADFRKRHDAQIYARYLAMDLSHKLQINGEVGIIPAKWRDEKGKADWDGVARMAAA